MASFVEIKPIHRGKVYSNEIKATERGWFEDFIFDTDIQNRFLIKHHEILLGIVFFYILFVKWIGPYYMRNRKPYELKNIMIVYNLFNAITSLVLAWVIFHCMWDNWDIRCEIRRNKQHDDKIKSMAPTAFFWFLNKNIDLLDTVFFILRKKESHVSFLNVSHHAGLVLFGIAGIKYNHYAYYMTIFFGINCSIHVVMYTYYGLAAVGPHMQKYLWWKKYITKMQIVQFLIFITYFIHSFVTGCEPFETQEIFGFLFCVMLLVLFLNFYRKSYKHHKS